VLSSRNKTLAETLAATNALPEGSFFQEHSRARELSYIQRSYGRWMDILRLIRQRLPGIAEASCLDVGCSPFTFLLKDCFKQVSALDLTAAYQPRCEAAGIQFHEGGVTSDAAVARIPKVDCVFMLEVLEHLHANPVAVIRRLRSVLRENGVLVVSTPNMMCLGNRGRMLLNRKLKHMDYPPFALDDSDHGFGHDRIYMPEELREYFLAAGFPDVETNYQLHFFGISEHKGWLRRARAAGVMAVKNLMPSLRDGIVMFGYNRPRSGFTNGR